MKTKHILILGIVLLALLGALAAKKLLVKPPIAVSEYQTLEITLNLADIYAVEIKKGDQLMRLERTAENTWRIPTHWQIAGNAQKIEELVNSIAGLQGELRSTAPELFADFGIAVDQAIAVTLFGQDGKTLDNFFISTKRPGIDSSFLRRGDSPQIFLVNKDLLPLIGLDSEAPEATLDTLRWMDLTIERFDPETIDSLTVVRRQNEKTLATVDLFKEVDPAEGLKRWIVRGEAPIFDIDAKKIKDFLKEINEIKAISALDPQGQGYGFENPYLKLSLTRAVSPLEILLGQASEENGEDRYLKNSQGQVLNLRRYNVNKLDADISRFFIDNPLRVNSDKLQTLAVTTAEKTILLDQPLISQNTAYLDKIKSFSVESILLDEKYTQGIAPAPYSLEITSEDSTLILDARKEDENLYVAQLRGKPPVLKISKDTFSKLFEGLESLQLEKTPAETKEETSAVTSEATPAAAKQ